MPQGLFGQGQGQPSPYNGHSQFDHESPFAPNPYQQSPWLQNAGAHNPPQSSFAGHYPGAHNLLQNSFAGHPGVNVPAQQIALVLAQLAQQIAVQSAVAQQIGIAVQQLAQQLATQGPGAGQAFAGGGQPFIGGAAQPFGLGGPILGNPGAQYFGPNSFSNTPQGGYGGFNPQQAQAWGANRPQTIQ
jgi:hypothetical protein